MVITTEDLVKITDYLWEIPKSFRVDMKVPARIFATKNMLEEIFKDRSLEQLINVTTLPGIQKAAIVMPDIHEGYGFPIGAVAATLYPNGAISPGGIGYDINCGVRLLLSELSFPDIDHHQSMLSKLLFDQIPSGVGRGGKLKLSDKELNDVLKNGAPWALKKGYGKSSDLEFLESGGNLKNADPQKVSQNAKDRGRDQIGTLGAGNHFIEVDKVEEIYDLKVAKNFGLFQNQIVVLIHTGSRGLGHQVATDYIKLMLSKLPEFGIILPDRELACAPFSSQIGKDYFDAMSASANFAWTNRQLITDQTRAVFKNMFKESGKLRILYDVAHNIAKLEEHEIEGKAQKLIVHRKGATRAFPPQNPEIPKKYKTSGQPVIIPGSMGSSSFILSGTKNAMKESFGSTCHGAGRKMSRHAAKRAISGKKLKVELEKRGIFIQTGSIKGLAEEAPLAYKNIHEVVDVVDSANIAKKVAMVKPIVVVKG